jgi:hypothetical protein
MSVSQHVDCSKYFDASLNNSMLLRTALVHKNMETEKIN